MIRQDRNDRDKFLLFIIRACQWTLMILCGGLGLVLLNPLPKIGIILLAIAISVCPRWRWNQSALGTLIIAFIGFLVLMVIPL